MEGAVDYVNNNDLLTNFSALCISVNCTLWKVSKQGVISGPYFPVFSPNTGK